LRDIDSFNDGVVSQELDSDIGMNLSDCEWTHNMGSESIRVSCKDHHRISNVVVMIMATVIVSSSIKINLGLSFLSNVYEIIILL